MTWEPNETTQMVIDDYLKTMKEELPWLLQITEFIQGCTVEDLDPYSVGLNTWPRLIRVKLRGEYNTDVWYREEMGLIVTDDVTVVRLREGEQYEIFRIGGSTGAGTGGVVYANPTASVGLAPVNGVLATAMRSDGAPQLSQTIAPTWTGVHTHAQDVILDDGVLNSPLLRFVGGSNDDEAFLYLQNDIILNASDLVISLVDNLGDSLLIINDSGGNAVITFDSNGGAIFNENGEDADFRIEGVGKVNLLFVDASTDRIGVGTATPVTPFHVKGTDQAMCRIESTHVGMFGLEMVTTSAAAGAAVKSSLELEGIANDPRFENQVYNNSGNPIWRLNYVDDAPTTVANIIVATDIGRVGIGTIAPGALLDVRGAAIFNEDAADADFRIEGTGEANLLFIDAGNDRVGIGTAAPSALFDVAPAASVTVDLFKAAGETSSVRGIEFSPLISNGINGSAAIASAARLDPTANVGTWYGSLYTTKLQGSTFNVTNLLGSFYRVDTDATYSGALTSIYALQIGSPSIAGSSPVNAYGLFIGNQAAGTGTNFAIFTNTGIVSFNDKVGIGLAAPAAKLHVDQLSTSAAIPVLYLDQADLSEEFIEFASTVGAGNPIDTAAIGTYYGKLRVRVAGVGYKYIALYNS